MSYYSDGEKKSDILLIILLIASLVTLFLIVINNTKKIQNLEEEISTLKTTKKIKKSDNVNTSENNTVKENNVYEIEENEPDNYVNLTEKDRQVLDYLNDVNDKADNLNTTEKSKAKGIFIGIVDFLFYDGKINDVSFDELSDEGKKEVLKVSSNIDTKLDSKFPNYKDTISSKTKLAFNRASDVIKKGSVKLSDFSREKLGKDNYNEIIRSRDELVIYTKDAVNIIGKTTGKITTSLKEKIKSWYEDIKK